MPFSTRIPAEIDCLYDHLLCCLESITSLVMDRLDPVCVVFPLKNQVFADRLRDQLKDLTQMIHTTIPRVLGGVYLSLNLIMMIDAWSKRRSLLFVTKIRRRSAREGSVLTFSFWKDVTVRKSYKMFLLKTNCNHNSKPKMFAASPKTPWIGFSLKISFVNT